MVFSNLFKANKSQAAGQNFFISLLLGNRVLQSGLWTLDNDEVMVLEKSSIKEYKNERDCLVKTDASLQELGPESENINQAVFAFEPSWVTNQGIKAAKTAFLKRLTSELFLQAVGFVVITEALVEHLSKQDALLSTLLLYVEEESISLSFVRRGKLLQSVEAGRSHDLVADFREALARLKKNLNANDPHYPAQILLVSLALDFSTLSDIQQRLLEVNWQEEGNFLQTPVVNLFVRKNLLEMITKQGGRAVAEAKGLLQTAQSSVDQTGSDAAIATKAITSFGVPIEDKELATVDAGVSTDTGTGTNSDLDAEFLDDDDFLEDKRAAFGPLKLLQNIKFLQDPSHHKMLIFGIIGGFLSMIVLAYLFLTLSFKALVKVDLKEKVFSKEVSISLDPEAESSDVENLVLKADLVAKKLSDRLTIETTGVKLIGESAKGKVTIFNKSDDEKTLAKGTVLSKGDLEFILQEEVKVASASVKENDDSETKEYGKSEAQVEAVEIGADSNLNKDDDLGFADYGSSVLTAEVSEDFSGGSSREIRVLSEEDQAKILTELKEKLVKQAEDEFKAETGEGKNLIPTGEVKQLAASYDAEVGDEVETLSLDLTVEVMAVSYLSDDLRPIASSVLSSELPEGYTLLDEDPEILSAPEELADEESAAIKLVANISAAAVPEIDFVSLAAEIKDQELSQAESILQDKEEIEQAEVVILPSLAKLFVKKMPGKIARIDFKIVHKID